MKFESKLPHVGTTIFTVMSKLATEHQAINLSQGFPNFPIDPILEEIVKKKASENVHQYAPMAGLPVLLDQISALVYKQYNRKTDPQSELLVTAGATQAIFTTIQALVHTGEEVIILDPSYDCYESPVILAGAKPVRIPLNEHFLPDWNRIRSLVTNKTRLIITNNPHNPSGTMWRKEDMVELENLVQKNPNLLVLSDEVYEYITFENKHLSVNYSEILRARSIITSSFGKTFHITGWKIGYIVAPKVIMNEIKKVHQFLVFCVNSLAQASLAEYMNQVNVHELGQFYQQKRDDFRDQLKNSRFELLPCEGTYFQLASYGEISDENDVNFAKRLVLEHGVATIPLSVFNANGEDRKMLRFCFAKDENTIQQAAEKLCKI
ncbi:MAG: aminotransferase class I/II-fold pyridoxal phosphate-dependent enzyme [Crocinitomicaceae bacterium]|nr:aminotransferase class I/II-fold pyridoxal phosphate-dependent enzyme [Crocinitomicaceae bacterium]MCF8443447.1 aminotransferase class I/II-fold pyridoxal phosphate-dependent enzyme [Crocinitomicaceae bacterium]